MRIPTVQELRIYRQDGHTVVVRYLDHQQDACCQHLATLAEAGHLTWTQAAYAAMTVRGEVQPPVAQKELPL